MARPAAASASCPNRTPTGPAAIGALAEQHRDDQRERRGPAQPGAAGELMGGVHQDRAEAAVGGVPGLGPRQHQQRGEGERHPARAAGRREVADHRHQAEPQQGQGAGLADPAEARRLGGRRVGEEAVAGDRLGDADQRQHDQHDDEGAPEPVERLRGGAEACQDRFERPDAERQAAENERGGRQGEPLDRQLQRRMAAPSARRGQAGGVRPTPKR